MSKRTVFTTVTPLPAGITREAVMETLHSHVEMIDLNPLVEERHPINPPPNATAEEHHCLWYSLTDLVQYLPGGLMPGKVSYTCCFHDLENGVQTHCYAPLGLNIRGKWTLGGSLPGEPIAPVEMGAGVPLHGLWLREDVDMKCNIIMTSFVKKTLKKSHLALVDRLVHKAQHLDRSINNARLNEGTLRTPEVPTPRPASSQTLFTQPSTAYSPSEYDSDGLDAESGVDSPRYNATAMPNAQLPQASKLYPPITLQSPQLEFSQIHPALRVGPAPSQGKLAFEQQSIYPKYDPSAYPQALDILRESASSCHDSIHSPGISNGRTSHQSPVDDIRHDGNRVRGCVWHSSRPLDPGTTPPGYRNSDPERDKTSDTGRQDMSMRHRVISPAPAYRAELEG